MHRALSVCAAITLLFPTAGSAQRRDQGLQLCIEAGVRTPKAAHGLSKVLENMPNVPTELTTAMKHLDQLETASYPVTFRIYTPGGWSYRDSPEPPYFLVVLDSANDLPIEQWLKSYGLPEGGSGSLVYRERERRDGGRRYLLGDRHKEVRNELRRLPGDDLPQPSRAQHRLLGKVSGNAAYACIDHSRDIPQPNLQALRGAGGTGGPMFAFGAQPYRGT